MNFKTPLAPLVLVAAGGGGYLYRETSANRSAGDATQSQTLQITSQDFQPDRIAKILREIQADRDAGLDVHQACRKAGDASTTYDRRNSLQEDLESIEQICLSEVEAAGGRLRLLVAGLALDSRRLQDALKKEP